MKKILLIFLIFILFASAAYARDYSVRLFSLEKKINSIKINTVGAPHVVPLQYNIPITVNRDIIFTVNGKTKQIYCKSVCIKKDCVIITTDIENLTSAVTLSEVHAYNLPEYIKAQAVCARSYIMSASGKHKKEGYDFCDSTCCQLINGKPMRADLVQIIKSTAGECLYGKKGTDTFFKGGPKRPSATGFKKGVCPLFPIPAFYHSTCGGVTAECEDVFLKPVNGIVSIKDTISTRKKDLCAYSPHYRWEFVISSDKLKNILNARRGTTCGAPTDVGNYLSDIQTPVIKNGRVKKIKFLGQNVKTISGYDFYLLMGNKLGWGCIESTFFTVRKICRDRTLSCPYFIFTGRGLGHGIGLCQYGAFKMAQLGYGYKKILKHYFPLAEIRNRG